MFDWAFILFFSPSYNSKKVNKKQYKQNKILNNVKTLKLIWKKVK